MKITKITISLISLFLITSCTAFEKRDLTAVEGNKIIVVNSAVGQFFFTANAKEKVAGGYKFNFSIGNKNYAQYEGLSLKVRWGKNPTKKDKNAKITAGDLKSEDVKISSLGAGEWKKFDVVIPAKNEQDMEILNLVIFAVEKVSLHSAK